VLFVTGCGGAVSPTPSDAWGAPDADLRLDASLDQSADDGASPIPDASTVDEDVVSSLDVNGMVDMRGGPDDARIDSPEGCECHNLDTCCQQAAQLDNGIACRANVARGDEAMCRTAVLGGKYGCLALGFVPRCSADDGLCPPTTTRCSSCLTAIRNCGPVIQCVNDPACKPTWDAVVACDQGGRPFRECFQILSSKGTVPGELVLLGAQCVDTCEVDR
jgi:hypothetical protein